jgi:phosphoserine phosphatase RsbU/P
VTQREEAAEAFYAALLEDDPQELYEAAPFAYLSTLPNGTIVKVNSTFLVWTGYERDALVGRRRFPDLLSAGGRIFYETHLAPELRMQGRVREIAVELVGPSGGRLLVLVNAVVKRDASGEPVMIRVALMDASERRAYERELLAARRRAEESEARAKTLARTLQASLLPPRILTVPGLDLAGAYRPAGDGTEVGGDFYDVFETGRGGWAVVLGDICGKGAAAAVLTGFVRYTLRAEALHTPDPSRVLGALNDALMHYHPDQFCTVLFLVVERSVDGTIRLTLASGGHPLPLRLTAVGGIESLGHAGTLIGLGRGSRWADMAVPLNPHDIVVLYTDGVTEARRDNEFFGQQRLRSTIASCADTAAQQIADGIVAAAIDFQDGYARDDIAVLVIKALPGA